MADTHEARPSRFCNLNQEEMQYVHAIRQMCSKGQKVFPPKMTRICAHLYIGNMENAENITNLNENGITCVVNTVEGEYENTKTGKRFYGDRFQYLGFLSLDEESYPILKHFDEVYNFIETARENNSKCLIHCMAGINRSGCLAAAYYMVFKGIGPISAVEHILQARERLLSNDGFIERLVRFASERNLLVLDKDKITSSFKQM